MSRPVLSGVGSGATRAGSPLISRNSRSERVDVLFDVGGEIRQQASPLPLDRCRAAPDVLHNAAKVSDEKFDDSLRVASGFGDDVLRLVGGGACDQRRSCPQSSFG